MLSLKKELPSDRLSVKWELYFNSELSFIQEYTVDSAEFMFASPSSDLYTANIPHLEYILPKHIGNELFLTGQCLLLLIISLYIHLLPAT